MMRKHKTLRAEIKVLREAVIELQDAMSTHIHIVYKEVPLDMHNPYISTPATRSMDDLYQYYDMMKAEAAK